jgi:hypothetical protein
MRQYKTPRDGRTISVCHIPKCFGSSLRKELLFSLGDLLAKPVATIFGTEEDKPTWDKIKTLTPEHFSLIKGHFILSKENLDILENTYIVTCVRKPMDIFLSHLSYIDACYKDNGQTLIFLLKERPYLFDNILTRYLSGYAPEHLISETESHKCIKDAKFNIINSIDFIFIDEFILEQQQLFLEMNNISIDLVNSKRVNTSTPSKWFLSGAVKNYLSETFQPFFIYDQIIYEHTRQCFIELASGKLNQFLSSNNN